LATAGAGAAAAEEEGTAGGDAAATGGNAGAAGVGAAGDVVAAGNEGAAGVGIATVGWSVSREWFRMSVVGIVGDWVDVDEEYGKVCSSNVTWRDIIIFRVWRSRQR
jgi:hypothetical protein